MNTPIPLFHGEPYESLNSVIDVQSSKTYTLSIIPLLNIKMYTTTQDKDV